MDVMRAEAEVSKRDQDLTVARTSLQLQELLIKNALTKSLDDPVLEAMPVVPVDRFESVETQSATRAIQDLITEALRDRPELNESDVDLVNRQISGKAARNALLPSLALVGFYGGSGLAGPLIRFTTCRRRILPTFQRITQEPGRMPSTIPLRITISG